MITYQDFKDSTSIQDFLVQSINKFKGSIDYLTACTSRRYYEGNNDILTRKPMFYDENYVMREDKFKANNKIADNFYKKIILQEKNYLLSNGVDVDEEFKEIVKLNQRINEATESSLLDGKAFFYCYIEDGKFKVKVLSGINFIPIYDEMSGELVAGIRFWQLEANRPTFIEFYEKDGVSLYKQQERAATLIQEKAPYFTTTLTDIVGNKQVNTKNWSRLPIIELKSDREAQGRFTTPLKSKIDLYDLILSDFGNNLEDSKEVFWTLKNYDGTDMSEFLRDFKHFKAVKVEDDGDAKMNTVETPYQARETALKILKTQIYDEAMAMDMSTVTGNVTNQLIKSMYHDLDLKADQLEEQLREAITALLELFLEFKNGIGVKVEEEINLKFVRNVLSNETETIDNLIKLTSAGLLSAETALKWNPYVEDADEELKILQSEDMAIFAKEEPTEEIEEIEV